MKSEKQIAAAAAEFAKRWAGRGYEKGDTQSFWIDLLTNVFGVEDHTTYIRFEEKVKSEHTNFIDAKIPSTKVLLEQKSINKDLREPILQSDGTRLTPFQQGKRYNADQPYSEHARWIVTCNFSTFLIYDMEQPNREPEEILLANLGKEYYRLFFLVDTKNEHIRKEMQVSMQAGEIVGRIYEALLKQYDDNSPEAMRWLNILCVRIVFCLYAEDAGVFNHDQFHDYLNVYEAKDLRRALRDLFEALKTPLDKRSKYLPLELQAFPYTNGGLFEEDIEIPQFTEALKDTLLQNASLDFDWSEISPTIFGAVFESTLNPETRRSGGMHYTSIENIHKVIDPLFLNDLRQELDDIIAEKAERQRVRKLDAYQNKLASLTFLDPACGSGNFLTETYLSLRRLENEAIRERYHGQTMMGEFLNPIKVSIQQFYGIEINDFAVTVATTALWISEAQMLAETERIIHRDIDFLPLKPYHNIREGNALSMDWDVIELPSDIPTIYAKNIHLIYEDEAKWRAGEPVVDFDDVNVVAGNYQRGWKSNAKRYEVNYDYIIGNPPFVGARQMSESQKQDVISLFGEKWKNVGNMDYVCCWYKRAYQLMKRTGSKAAFVSTNSICQGEQVANLWQPLMEDGLRIDFAYRTFRWDSEASLKAHVHCVIVGFSQNDYKGRDCLINDNGNISSVKHINAYLTDGPDVFVGSRQKPICNVPEIGIGNLPIDGGNYLFTKEQMEEFVKIEPKSANYFRPWYGSEEFIHQKPRYCLWLGNCSPAELRQMPHSMKRIEAVRTFRSESKRAATRKLADNPIHFSTENMPDGNYIIVPKVSSERRRYVPMGFMPPEVMASDLVFLIPNATLYHFGILESIAHMGWMRVVCGRLEMRYRYSKDVVYNNFPWPTPTEAQKAKIEQAAQAILDARALYPDSSLADLYDEVTMPIELRRAHEANDRAVIDVYGFDAKWADKDKESSIVAELFKMYQELTKSL